MAAWQRSAYPEGKADLYRLLESQLAALMAGETEPIPNLANTSALLYQALPQINWAGFYLYKDGVLVLGPFQGMPACIRIPMGRGVCGALVGVMDIDSPVKGRFDEADREGLERLARRLAAGCAWRE